MAYPPDPTPRVIVWRPDTDSYTISGQDFEILRKAVMWKMRAENAEADLNALMQFARAARKGPAIIRAWDALPEPLQRRIDDTV